MDIRLKEPHRQRAVLIDGLGDREAFLDGLLLDRGIAVIARYASLAEACLARALPECDLVIVYLRTLTATAERDLGRLGQGASRPVLLICETDAPDQIAAGVIAGAHAVLSVGAASDRLRTACVAAIAQFERVDSLRRRALAAERDLETRKLVERAKGILMSQRGIGEGDAYRELQRVSMNRNEPIGDVARSIIAAKELLG